MPMIVAGDRRGRAPIVRIKRPSDRRSTSRSAIRALDVLEQFGTARRPLRAFEIARALDLQPSTTDQLLKTMVDSGHLVFDAQSKRYAPSPRLVGFSSWLIGSFGADDSLRELVRDLQRASGLLATLTTSNDLFMQVIDMAVPDGWRSERGLRISLFGSVIGSAHLSTLDGGELDRLAYRARIPAAEMPAMRDTIMAIRAAGYADGASSDGANWSIAMPLPPALAPIPLVLGLAGDRGSVEGRCPRLYVLMTEAVGRRTAAPIIGPSSLPASFPAQPDGDV